MVDKTMDFKALQVLLIDEHIRLETMLRAVMSQNERTQQKIEDFDAYIRRHSCSVCEGATKFEAFVYLVFLLSGFVSILYIIGKAYLMYKG